MTQLITISLRYRRINLSRHGWLNVIAYTAWYMNVNYIIWYLLIFHKVKSCEIWHFIFVGRTIPAMKSVTAILGEGYSVAIAQVEVRAWNTWKPSNNELHSMQLCSVLGFYCASLRGWCNKRRTIQFWESCSPSILFLHGQPLIILNSRAATIPRWLHRAKMKPRYPSIQNISAVKKMVSGKPLYCMKMHRYIFSCNLSLLKKIVWRKNGINEPLK